MESSNYFWLLEAVQQYISAWYIFLKNKKCSIKLLIKVIITIFIIFKKIQIIHKMNF